MLALMARQLRWERAQSQVQTAALSTGADLDFTWAPADFGETYTRVHFSFQMVHDRPSAAVGAWSIIGSVGLISSIFADTSPPARPLDNPGADWLWLEPMIWSPAQVTFNSEAVVSSNLQECNVQNRSVRAQRRMVEGGGRLWLVFQWQPALISGAVMRRRCWGSAGILEA